MQRLSGLDAGFLTMETPTSHMHVAGLMIFDPSTSPTEWSIDQVKQVYEERLHLAPPFRRRLKDVPGGIHHPLWIEDPSFDLDFHIRHVGVPAPGGMRELADLASELVAIPLDRSKPLWELWVIDGLEDGHVAVLSKVHHAAIDGASGNEITVATLDLTPEGDEVPPPEEPWEPDRIPSETELVAYALGSLARQPLGLVRALRRTIQARGDRAALDESEYEPPGAFSAPRTSMNAPLTARRTLAHTTLALSEVKEIKNRLGVTVNDVILALCSGALRRYFDAAGEELDGSLVAMVPVSVRTEEQQGDMGNQVSSMFCSLASDIDDPAERVAMIHAGTQRAKERHAVDATALQDWSEFAAPALLGRAVRLYSRRRLARMHRPAFNVTISNVPGPPFPLYSAGAKLVGMYPLGPIFDGGGLNMTVMSHEDSLDFGLLACPDVVPDVWSIADGLGDALEELKKASAGVGDAAPARGSGERVP